MKTKPPKSPAPLSAMQIVKQKQSVIIRDLDALSKSYGAEVFRIVGQRYFKHQRERDALKREIGEREQELAALQRKATA